MSISPPTPTTEAHRSFAPNRKSHELVENQIAAFLRNAIRTGHMAVGARLPATSELARQWGVNLVAVHKALRTLAAEGLLHRRPRYGTTVARTEPAIRIGVLLAAHLDEDNDFFTRARDWTPCAASSPGVAGNTGFFPACMNGLPRDRRGMRTSTRNFPLVRA